MNRLFAVFGLVAAVVISAVLTLWPTDDPSAVSHKFAQRVAAEVPGVQVAPAGEFMLYLSRGERVWGVSLDQLQNRCHEGAGVCKTAGTELLAEIVRLTEAAPRPEMALLRPTLAAPPAPAPFASQVITQPWVGDLAIRYDFMGPLGTPIVEFVTTGLARSLKLDPKQLQAQAIAAMDGSNEAPVLRPLLGKRGVSYLEAKGDPAGEVLSRARMQVLAERTGVTKFYLGFPVRNMVLFANANTADGLADIQLAVADMRAAFGAQPVSDRIYVLEQGELAALP
ncbi:MAG: hypothetical protein RR101_07300 [Burkholderiaceae bacterium]